MSAAIVILALVMAASARAESTYDQPYLGEWPGIWNKFSARHLSEQFELGLAGKARKSDAIILGAAHNLTEIKVTEPVARIQFYEADVNVLRVFKGELEGRKLHLKFVPSATSIADGAEHVFFLKSEKGQQPSVIEAWYVYPERYNLMRVVGAYNCSKDVVIGVLLHLVSGKRDAKLASKLLNEYRDESWEKMYSAVVMAAAVPPEIGNDTLLEMVSVKERKRFDFQLYCLAAHALAEKQGDAGLRVLLKNIPQFRGYGRIAESVVFDLVATYGSDRIVPDIKALVHTNPEFVVSAAFAIAGIGGKSCKESINAFLNNEQLASRSERISDGSSMTTESVQKLLKRALAQCPREHGG